MKLPPKRWQRRNSMDKEKIKEDFINAFGHEKWDEEEMLERLIPIHKELAEYLNVPMIPVVVEDIEEDSRFYFKELFIGISKRMLKDFNDAVKSFVPEVRHEFQILCCITDKYDNKVNPKLLLQWMNEIPYILTPVNIQDENSMNKYYAMSLELDAHAFSKWYLKKYLGIETHFPNKDYDKIIDKYIEKYINK
jgi:hypothetical protein